jgi:imidazolonepropionase-like amidohydrolase
MAITILENCLIFDGVNEELIEGSVVVEQNRIREVTDGSVKINNAESLDCKGDFLMPGLIDAHFHALLVSYNIPKLDSMPPYLLAQHAGHILNGALHRGFTTVRDAGGAEIGLAMALQQGLIEGPRMFFSGKPISQTGGHGDMRPADQHSPCSCGFGSVLTVVADGVDEMRKTVREELRKGANQIKLFVSGGVVSPTDPIWMAQFSNEEILVAVEEAATRRTYVMAHCHTDDRARACVELGIRTIEHGTEIHADTAKIIANSDTYVVPTLSAIKVITDHGEELGLPPMSLEKVRGLFQTTQESLANCDSANVKLGFGTDLLGDYHKFQNDEFLLRGELQSNIDVLRSATSVNAEILQQSGHLGCIGENALADMILVSGNPLNDIKLLAKPHENICMIMRDGNVIKNSL